MSEAKGWILIAADQQVVVVRVVGRGAMQQSQLLHEWLEGTRLADRTLTFDLAGCHYLDSTFLGYLVKLHKRLSDRLRIAPAAHAQPLLATIGLHKLLHLIDAAPAVSSSWEPLGASPPAVSPEYILECHEELADRDDPSSGVFRQVCQSLRDELKSR